MSKWMGREGRAEAWRPVGLMGKVEARTPALDILEDKHMFCTDVTSFAETVH